MARRSAAVTLGLTTVVAATLTGCSTASAPEPAPFAAEWSADETMVVDPPVADAEAPDAAVDGTDVEDDGSAAPVEYTAVCVDESGEQRVDDASCAGLDPEEQRVHGGHGGAFLWYFLRAGSAFPAVGSRVHGGSYTTPSRPYAVGGLPATKGTLSAATRSSVSKGGFGGSARSGSVGG